MARYNHNGGNEEYGRKRRFATSSAIAIAMGLAALAGMAQHPAHADDQQLQLLEDQIRQLQAQIDGLKTAQAKQAATTQAPAAAIGNNKPAYGYQTGSHQFGWASADGQDSIELTGRFQFDGGDYVSYAHQGGYAAGAAGSNLNGGVDARRARVGITGKFAGDFAYTLIYDFGGTLDSGTAATNPGGIENGFITYNGFNKPTQTVPVALDAGYLDVPWTLNESISSNDILFIERSSAQVIATAFGGGDFRSAAGLRSYKSNYWVGGYVTGPQSGAAHAYNLAPNGETLAYLGRATYNPYQDADTNTTIHVGANYSHLEDTGAGAALGNSTLTLSDRPELRIDPTALLNTGAMTHVSGGDVYGAEAAATYQNFFVDGEFYRYDVTAPKQTLIGGGTQANPVFYGGYTEASYSIGGKRSYNPSTGAYSGVIPANPLSLSGSGWGAVEFAARFSSTDLDDHKAGVEGGYQTTYGLGVNYYPLANVRVMFDYLHTDLTLNSGATQAASKGADINALATRLQVSW